MIVQIVQLMSTSWVRTELMSSVLFLGLVKPDNQQKNLLDLLCVQVYGLSGSSNLSKIFKDVLSDLTKTSGPADSWGPDLNSPRT